MFPRQVFIEFAQHQYDDDASGDSDVLSRELRRQLSVECSGEASQPEADTRL